MSAKSDCLIWTRANDGRYGQISVGGKPMKAHRFAWIMAYGPIPSGMFVLHRCDVTLCVNPKHLFLGTQADNIRDMSQKGRNGMQRYPERSNIKAVAARYRGEDHARSKLTAAQVSEMRRLWASGTPTRALGRMFGVSGGHAQKVVAGKQWATIDAALKE